MYKKRKYRGYTKADDLIKFEVIECETDLLILADKDLSESARQSVLKYREQLIKFINQYPEFLKTLHPFRVPLFVPQIIRNMAWAAKRCKVGPMAAVAGAIAELTGQDLLPHTKEIIIENGGDNFLKITKPRKVGVFAGNSPFSEKIALEIDPQDTPCGICTSSGTVGHSLSFGKADAVCVISRSAALADAAATAIGNVVQDVNTIDAGLKLAKKIRGLKGVLIIKGDKMGILGKIKIVPI
jgi:hypothetical protein